MSESEEDGKLEQKIDSMFDSIDTKFDVVMNKIDARFNELHAIIGSFRSDMRRNCESSIKTGLEIGNKYNKFKQNINDQDNEFDQYIDDRYNRFKKEYDSMVIS